MKIFYIAYDGIVSLSVFDSQVLGLLKNLEQSGGIMIELIAFESAPVFFARHSDVSKKLKFARALGIDAFFYPRVPGRAGIFLAVVLLWLKFLFAKNREEIFLHSRGAKAAFIGCLVKKLMPGIRVAYDSRGLEPEEYLYTFGLENPGTDGGTVRRGAAFMHLKEVEKASVAGSDVIFCVSGKLKEHYLVNYGIPEEKIKVVPCGIDASAFFFDRDTRGKTRAALNLENRLVFVYSGIMHKMEMAGTMALFFQKILRASPDAFLLFLTPDAGKAGETLKAMSIPADSYKVVSADHAGVPQYLNAADAGVILREKNDVNGVASPVKVLEYLTCGLFTVLTEGIGDVSVFAAENRLGEVLKGLSGEDLDLAVSAILSRKTEIRDEENRERISKIARGKYSWEQLIPAVLKGYAAAVNAGKGGNNG